MPFQVKVENSVNKRFGKLHPKHALQVARRMRDLENKPRPHDSIKLKGADNAFRVDVGEYRILYEIDYDAQVVTIYRLIQRGEGY